MSENFLFLSSSICFCCLSFWIFDTIIIFFPTQPSPNQKNFYFVLKEKSLIFYFNFPLFLSFAMLNFLFLFFVDAFLMFNRFIIFKVNGILLLCFHIIIKKLKISITLLCFFRLYGWWRRTQGSEWKILASNKAKTL